MNQEILEKLRHLSAGNSKYRDFHSRIANDLSDIEFIGVRVPELRKIAKDLSRKDYWHYLKNNDWQIYETKQIAFLLPTYLKQKTFEEFFSVIDFIAPHTSSWANTDALGLELPYEKNLILQKVKEYSSSPDPWTLRIGLNIMFHNLIDDQYLKESLSIVKQIDSRYREKSPRGSLNYYVKMMLAWTLAEIAIAKKDLVLELLPLLDQETAKYTNQKMRDSRRVKT